MSGDDKRRPRAASVKAPDITVESGPGDEPSQAPQPDDAALPEQREPKVSASGDGDDAAAAEAEVERLRAQVDGDEQPGWPPQDGPAMRPLPAFRRSAHGCLAAVGRRRPHRDRRAARTPVDRGDVGARRGLGHGSLRRDRRAARRPTRPCRTPIIDRITTEIFDRLDVEAVTQQAVDALAAQGLPPRVADSLDALATPLANGVRSFVTERVAAHRQVPEFEEAWVAANREAHTQLVAVLTGEGTDTIDVTGNTVSVNLAAVIDTVKAQLANAGFALASRIPEVNAQFTIFESADLAKAQNGVPTAQARGARPAHPRAAPARGRGVRRAGPSPGADGGRAGGRRRRCCCSAPRSTSSARSTSMPFPPTSCPHDAAASIYDTLTQFIRLNLRAVLVVSLAIAAGAWLSGASAAAVAIRRGIWPAPWARSAVAASTRG